MHTSVGNSEIAKDSFSTLLSSAESQHVGGCLLMPHLCIAVNAELFHVDQIPHVKSPMRRLQIQVELHVL